jgi:hypothetical protein
MTTRLQFGSTITTGSTSAPGLGITVGPTAPGYQWSFAITDYNGYLIFLVTPKNSGAGHAIVGGDNLNSMANVLAGSYICLHGGNEQYASSVTNLGLEHVPPNLWFPDGTVNQGAHIFTGTGAPSASTVQGSAQTTANGATTLGGIVSSGFPLVSVVNLASSGSFTVIAQDTSGNTYSASMTYTGIAGGSVTGCSIVTGTSSSTVANGAVATFDTSGWGELGDVYHRRDGSAGSRIYICTVAGQPGTWTAVL